MNSQKLYTALFNSAAEGLLVVDNKGNIIKVNTQAEEMFGYLSDELPGKSIEELIPKEYHTHHLTYRSQYMQNPHKRSMGKGMDLFGLRKNGETFPVEISLNYFESEGEKYAMTLITDITERKKSESKIIELNQELESRVDERTRELENANEALKESQFLYSSIARNFPNGTINVFDRDLNYVFVEGKELYKMGITGDKLIGTKFTNRLEPEVARKIENELSHVFQGENRTIEIEYKENYYILEAVPLTSNKKKIDRILVVETNITPYKIARQNMQKALEKEKQLNELKSRFVSMASHEFRTPLASILSSVTLLEKYNDPKDDDKRKKHIYRIKSGVNNLTGILNDFLSLDKLEEGKIQSTPDKQIISELGNEIIEEMQAMTKMGQVIQYKHNGKKVEFFIDKQILRNILINLISNAIKYSEENKQIDVKSEIKEDHLYFSVTDQGIGIPLEDQVHLFDRFFRASNAINIQGTGLGLNIIVKYLDIIGGKIDFVSAPGMGTTFNITIKEQI